jgi:hypothetical protein
LENSGFDLGPDRDRWERHLIAVAREKPRIFCFDRQKRELSLAPTAFDPPPPKLRGTRTRPNGACHSPHFCLVRSLTRKTEGYAGFKAPVNYAASIDDRFFTTSSHFKQ